DEAYAVVAVAEGGALRRHAHLRFRRRDAVALARPEDRRLARSHVAGPLRREGRRPAPAQPPPCRRRSGDLLYPWLGGRAPHRRGARHPRRRALLPDAPAAGAPAHAEPGGDLRDLARRVPRLLRVGRALQPRVPSSGDRPPVEAPHAASADPLDETPPRGLVGERE